MFYKVEKPETGDLIRVRRKAGYFHFGIVTGENSVVHFSDIDGDLKSGGGILIRETTLEIFAKNRAFEVENHSKSPFSQEEIVDRARSFIGASTFRDKTYNLLTNNCEHFARYIFEGVAKSSQITDGSHVVKATATQAVHSVGKLLRKNVFKRKASKTKDLVKK